MNNKTAIIAANDNDGRFTLYFTPLLATAAVLICCKIITALKPIATNH